MTSSTRILRVWATILAAIFFAAISSAHDPQLSGIGIVINGDAATIAVQAHLNKLSPADPSGEIVKRLALSINGKSYVPSAPQISLDSTNGIAYWKAEYAGSIRTLDVSHRLFPEDSGSRTIVSVTRDGVNVQDTILDSGHPAMQFGGQKVKARTPNVVQQFLALGVTHIFTGFDHILFILGLILMGGGLKPLLKTVTAFTLAHSITLSIAATGIWTPASKYVEPLIALSIVAIAIENLRKRESAKDWRPLIAFGFGIIHGFGFAGGLIEAALPQGAIGWALASFNIGVECAQASIVLIAVPFLTMLARTKPQLSYRVVFAGSLAIALAGGFWFIERVRFS